MFYQETLPLFPSAISSPELASGLTPCDKPDGPMIDLSGQVVVRANLSARQAKEQGFLMSGIYGLRSITSSNSADLSRSLANRLREKTDLLGSTLYSLTWKERVTPLGRLIPALRASVRRTSDSDCTGWPTPSVRDYKGGYQGGRIRNGKISTDTLDVAAQLAGWRTPSASDSEGGVMEIRPGTTGRYKLRDEVHLAVRQTVSGEMLIGSDAKMESGGQLNPAHSRWLMALPPSWDDCAVTAMPLTQRQQKRSSKRT